MATNDGGPFHPILDDVEFDSGHALECTHKGVSLRDWLAGQALAGILSQGTKAESDQTRFFGCYRQSQRAIAKHAYGLADAMLKAREEKAGGK